MFKDVQNSSNLSAKIILMAEIVLLISSMLFCGVSLYRARLAIRKNIQQRMLDIANCAAGSVDGDVLGALKIDDVGSDEYNDLYRKLAVFRDNVELEYIYSLKQTGEEEFIFTMDLDKYTPASYGDPTEYTDALGLAGDGTAAVDEVPYSDKWGQFYSAYSPVFDSKGNVAGIIVVDFSAEWFDNQLSSQTWSTVTSYLIILLISLLVAAALLLGTVRPFVKMQGQLLEEKVRAESANHAKSDFLANMSHEIRTPINAMLGMNEMILRESRKSQSSDNSDPEEMRRSMKNIIGFADDVENAGQNLLAIINDILDFSKIDSGRMDLVEKPYRVSSMISAIGNMVMLKARDKGLDFIIDADPLLPDELCGDELRVRQVLTNLLNNAVKYTDHGSVTMMLCGRTADDGTFLLEAAIKDTGIGIRQEDLEKLFKRFQRLEMDRNSTVEGTGLGLAITQRLLELMDGNISVESLYGKGSVFTVTIPQKVVSEDIATEEGATVSDTPRAENTQETGTQQIITERESFVAPTARVLAVDDTLTNLTVVTYLLKDTKIAIDTAMSGADAVEMARKTHYDVILMDQRMPGMDGTEAFHKIRSGEGASSDSPVICFTADAVVGARERYLEEGFSDYITKPINGYALEKMLMDHLPEAKIKRVTA